MRKEYRIIFVLVVLVCFILSGCIGGKPNVQLTEEQEAKIDLIVQHRDEWDETIEGVVTLPVNRLHISETDDGMTILSVGNVRDATTDSWEIFAGVRGFAVENNEFVSIGRYHHEAWIVGIDVDLENMSDKKLRDVLIQSYIDYLSKK